MRTLTAVVLMAAGLSGPTVLGSESGGKTVVFVCEHGTVKSVIAMLWFNKLAAERGTDVRAISRGLAPDPVVPPAIADNLARDGLDLGAFVPKPLRKEDLAGAVRVVAIGADTTAITAGQGVSVEAWSDIPPATQDYAAARDAIRLRIDRLLASPSSLEAPAGAAAQPAVDLPAALARVLTDYEAAWGARNAAALAALFAEDGFVLPAGKAPVRGRAAIERYYTGHGGPLSLRALAYGIDGSLGYIIGGYAGAKGQPDDGKFTLTLRKDAGGRWWIVSDMDNSNR